MNHPSSLHAALLALPVTLVTVRAETKPVDTTPLDAMTVTASGETEDSYQAPESTTGAMKSEVPLLETPQAVSVVTESLIKDQNAVKLTEVLRNVAGVSTGGYYSDWDYYRIRGFDASFNTFWDGLRGDYGMGAETFGLERVEVIKGPASSLYGQAPLGGIVNLVSKRPKNDTWSEFGFTAGSFNSLQGTVDANAPLYTAPGGVGIYGRFTGLYRDEDSFIDHVDRQRLFLAPSFTFKLGDDTTLTLLSQYTHDTGVFAMPLPAKGTVLPNVNGEIDISRFLGLPGASNEIDQSRARVGYELNHRFNDLVSLRQNFSYSQMNQEWENTLYNSSLSADEKSMNLYPYYYDETLNRVGLDTALDFTFETGKIRHVLTVGTDYYFERSDNSNRQIDYADPDSYVSIDLFDPDYNFTIPAYATSSSGISGSESIGFYFQDHAKLTDQVTLTFGGRYDQTEDRGTGVNEDAFSPKVGATYEFIPGVAAYANYSTAFEPQWSSTDANGTPVSPEEGENIEGGLKYRLLGDKLTGMASVFHLTRSNIATADLSTPNPFDSTVSGEQRSQGFEFENAYQPVDGLEISAAYTYIDAEVTEDNTIPEGTRLPGVPENNVNVWLKYTIQEGPLEGLGFGVGGRYFSSQGGDQADSFELPSYGLLDAALYYTKDNFTAQVNFNNITDKRHFVGAYNDLYVLPGEPFNVAASVGWKF